LQESFKAFDKNSDGKITKEELIAGYKKIYKHLGEAEILKQVD
jgi:Ca2+-binding EF-hand superfamily protein